MSDDPVDIVKIDASAFAEKHKNAVDSCLISTICVKLVFMTESKHFIVLHMPAVVKEGWTMSGMIFRVQLLGKLIKREQGLSQLHFLGELLLVLEHKFAFKNTCLLAGSVGPRFRAFKNGVSSTCVCASCAVSCDAVGIVIVSRLSGRKWVTLEAKEQKECKTNIMHRQGSKIGGAHG